MRYFITIITLIILIGCSNKKKSHPNIDRLEPNLYDHFYLDLLSQNKQANILNIDSLNPINNLDSYFSYLENTGLLEKIKMIE